MARRGWDPPSPALDSSGNLLLHYPVLLRCKAVLELVSGSGGVIRDSRLLETKRGLKFPEAFCIPCSWLVPSHR